MARYLVFPVHSFCVCIGCFHMGEQSQEGFFCTKGTNITATVDIFSTDKNTN